MRRTATALLASALLASAAAPARAERVVLSLSADRVAITSNYTGAELVAFGLIERDAQSVSRQGSYDVVVTVTGPREAVTVRRKEGLGPVWLNRSQQKFVSIPSFLGVSSSRMLDDVAGPALRRRFRLGLDAVVSAPEFAVDRGAADDTFRDALVRLKRRDGLYVENGRGIAFVTRDLFRAQLPLPATAPIGAYEVEASLVSDGIVIARGRASFELLKTGFEDQITTLARDHPFLSGLSTAAMSLLFGWIASVIFRRD